MARDTSSPHEAAIARQRLETMAANSGDYSAIRELDDPKPSFSPPTYANDMMRQAAEDALRTARMFAGLEDILNEMFRDLGVVFGDADEGDDDDEEEDDSFFFSDVSFGYGSRPR